MPGPARLAPTLVLTAALVTGCTGGGSEPEAAPTSSPSVVGDVDLTGLPIPRAPFCERLDEGDLRDALGGPVAGATAYGNGDKVELTPGHTGISHEYNCTFTGPTGTQARAWVFAAPVTRGDARSLVRASRHHERCRSVDGLQFGTPGVTTLCREEGSSVVTLRGLFGDAWFSCELTLPRGGDTDPTPREAFARAQDWCVSVATTLGARG